MATRFANFVPTKWIASVLLLLGASPASAENVALTFDDLPYFGRSTALVDAETSTTRLIAGLRRNHLRAIGFDNEIQLDRPDRAARVALLSRWLDAEMTLGNHSYSHFSLTSTPVQTYIDDVARGEAVTRPLMAAYGRRERWFRHPFVETGPTLAIRREFENWLAVHGYRVAPVTLENSDWQFAYPYEDAIISGRIADAVRIRAAYLEFTDHTVAWYRKAAFQLLGRHPALVFLLHASRLNADSIDALAVILKTQGLHSVTLDNAMRDRAYSIPDTYAGPNGDEWLTRWGLTLNKDLPWGDFPEVPDDIKVASDNVEALPPTK